MLREQTLERTADPAVALAYEAGFQRAITLAAERVDELDATWRSVERPSYEERVAERVRQLERQAVIDHQRWGTRPFAGLENGAELPRADW